MPKNKSKKTLNTKEILRVFWQLSSPYKWRRNLNIAVSTLTMSIGVFVGPAIIASFLDAIQNNNLDSGIWWLVGAFALSQLWSEVIGVRLSMYLTWTFESAMQKDLAIKVFDKLTKESLFFHSNRFGGSLVSQSNKLIAAVERFWDTIIWSILPVIISLVGTVVILSFIFWQYAVFLLIFSIIFSISIYFGSRPMAKLNEAEAEASNRLSGRLSDAVSNVLAVKSSGAEKREIKEYSELTIDWREKMLSTMRGFLKVSTGYSLINTTILIGSLAFAVYASTRGLLSIASIYLMVSYTSSVARNLWNMNGIMRTYNRVVGDSQAMVEILQKPTSLIDRSETPLLVKSGQISINEITYVHDEGDGAKLFDGFSLNIKAGEKVGLVGASGSGKTTLTKLLMRFADIDKGQIAIDKQSISQTTQHSLRSAISYVPQEPMLFHRSVKENIAYAKPEASDKEIKDAAQKAEAHDFIKNLKDGYDTLVGERGVKLSGGQRQRIAIARAILKDAPILILDEATSALDSESESLIQKSLDTLMKDRTSIVIAHRLSTISKLDRIIVMESGKIVEDGSHSDLINDKGVYAKLWQHQSGGFIEE